MAMFNSYVSHNQRLVDIPGRMGMPSISMQQSPSNFGIKPATMRGIFMRTFPGFKAPIRVWKWDIPWYTRTSLRFIEKWVSLSKQNWEFTNQHSSSSKNWITNSAQCSVQNQRILRATNCCAPRRMCPPLAQQAAYEGDYQPKQPFKVQAQTLPLPFEGTKLPKKKRALTWIPSLQILEIRRKLGTWTWPVAWRVKRSFWTSHFCIQFFTHQIPGKENMNREVDVGNCTKNYFLNFTQKPTETIPTCILLWNFWSAASGNQTWQFKLMKTSQFSSENHL